jgi:hypothetical protein
MTSFKAPIIPLYDVWMIAETSSKYRYIGSYSVYQLQGPLTLDAMRKIIEDPSMALYIFPPGHGPRERCAPQRRLHHEAERGSISALIKSFVKTFDATMSACAPFTYVMIVKGLGGRISLEVGCHIGGDADKLMHYLFDETGLEWTIRHQDEVGGIRPTPDANLGMEPKGWPTPYE